MSLMLHQRFIVSEICEFLRSNGNSSGPRVRDHCLERFSSKDVEDAVEAAIAAGIISRERGGYGGLIVLKDLSFKLNERDLYSEMAPAISQAWTDAFEYEAGKVYAQVTAGITTEGRWSRPDISLICIKNLIYAHTKIWDLVTFEIKRPDDIDVLAVFEALAHRSAATRSFVVFPVSSGLFDKSRASGRIREECAIHGIGLVVAEEPWSAGSYEMLIPAVRMETNMEKIDQFVRTLGGEFDRRLRDWH